MATRKLTEVALFSDTENGLGVNSCGKRKKRIVARKEGKEEKREKRRERQSEERKRKRRRKNKKKIKQGRRIAKNRRRLPGGRTLKLRGTEIGIGALSLEALRGAKGRERRRLLLLNLITNSQRIWICTDKWNTMN
ncbi:Hypothetical predicted protein [Podarcis lilfordi]|uniref:Uncharacterized protein n=1 Tax=Podarcis lilfordi TaxID=74358 RepID=A0AA35LL30_9SAUR|nr:Hypothetical predicted protein [Podarcis lilfordi]